MNGSVTIDEYLNHIFDEVDANIKLDENQKKAVLCTDSHLLIIAGAGSGKTTSMSAKVKFLIEKKDIKESEILVISFTNKATDEIKTRISEDFGYKNVEVLTFHKLGMKILKKGPCEFTKIITEKEKYQIIFEYLKDIVFPNKELLHWYCENFDGIQIVYSEKNFPTLEDYFIYDMKMNNQDVELHKMDQYFKNFIQKYVFPFLSLYKSSDLSSLPAINSSKLSLKLERLKDLYEYYEKALQINHWIDFDDMILKAIKVLPQVIEHFQYRYIIIDEYQDISYQRYRLIQKFTELTDVKVMAVGDDFQAIFSFAGSKIDLFTGFEHYFPGAKMIPIVRTYRNSQELVDLASDFILKNKSQFQKELISPKHLKKPIEIWETNQEEFASTVADIICQNHSRFPHHNMLILGRYQEDIKILLKSEHFYMKDGKLFCKWNEDVSLTFMTVHSSKGLGFDDCILINTLNDIYGFPSKVKNDDVFAYLYQNKEEFVPYPEERRLFYVALTRTKNKFYMVTTKEKSIFIDEIYHHSSVLIRKNYTSFVKKSLEYCPKCNQLLYVRKYQSFYFYECFSCHEKFSSKMRCKKVTDCPLCHYPVRYTYTNANGYEIYQCFNDNCHYRYRMKKNIWTIYLRKWILFFKNITKKND